MILNIHVATKNEGMLANHISKLIIDEFQYYGLIRSSNPINEYDKAALTNAMEGITYSAVVGNWYGTGAELVKQALPDDQDVIMGAAYSHYFFIVFGY